MPLWLQSGFLLFFSHPQAGLSHEVEYLKPTNWCPRDSQVSRQPTVLQHWLEEGCQVGRETLTWQGMGEAWGKQGLQGANCGLTETAHNRHSTMKAFLSDSKRFIHTSQWPEEHAGLHALIKRSAAQQVQETLPQKKLEATYLNF